MRKSYTWIWLTIIFLLLFALIFSLAYQASFRRAELRQAENEVIIKVLTAPQEQYTFSSILPPPVEVEFSFERSSTFHYLDIPLSHELQEYTYYIAQLYNVEYEFILAIMNHESGFNPGAMSVTDDYGLMQINAICVPYLSQIVGIETAEDLLDPYINVQCGAHLLRGLFEKYNDAILVLMCYQYGEGGAAAMWEKGIHYTDYAYVIYNTYCSFKGIPGSST